MIIICHYNNISINAILFSSIPWCLWHNRIILWTPRPWVWESCMEKMTSPPICGLMECSLPSWDRPVQVMTLKTHCCKLPNNILTPSVLLLVKYSCRFYLNLLKNRLRLQPLTLFAVASGIIFHIHNHILKCSYIYFHYFAMHTHCNGSKGWLMLLLLSFLSIVFMNYKQMCALHQYFVIIANIFANSGQPNNSNGDYISILFFLCQALVGSLYSCYWEKLGLVLVHSTKCSTLPRNTLCTFSPIF